MKSSSTLRYAGADCVHRLVALQTFCADTESSDTPNEKTKPECLLFVAGVDGGRSRESARAILYLLFGRSCTQIIHSSVLPSEEDEETILVVSRHALSLYCHPKTFQAVAPFVQSIPNAQVYCLPNYVNMDMDDVEDFKIRTFVDMLSPFRRVGIPLSYRDDTGYDHNDEFEVEMWPIVKAFALDEYGGHGFFTMRHDVVNISSLLQFLYHTFDSRDLVELSTSFVHPLCLEFSQSLEKLALLSGVGRSSLVASEVGNDLISYHRYCSIRGVERSEISWLPRVSFGDHINVLDRDNIPVDRSSQTWMSCFGCPTVCPVIHIRASEGRYPIMFYRSLFVGAGHSEQDSFFDSSRIIIPKEEQEALRYYNADRLDFLEILYFELILAFDECAERLCEIISIDLEENSLGICDLPYSKSQVEEYLASKLRVRFPTIAWDQFLSVRCELARPLPKVSSLFRSFYVSSSPLVYLEVGICNLPPELSGCEFPINLGYGDTLACLFIPPNISSRAVSVSQRYSNLTERAPSINWFADSGWEMINWKNLDSMVEKLRNSRGVVHDDLGPFLLDSIPGRCEVAAVGDGPFLPCLSDHEILFFEGGFIVREQSLGYSIFSFSERRVVSISQVEHTFDSGEGKTLDYILFLFDCDLSDKPPLYRTHRNLGVTKQVVLYVRRHTSTTSDVFSFIVPAWRTFCEENHIAFDTVDSVPPLLLDKLPFPLQSTGIPNSSRIMAGISSSFLCDYRLISQTQLSLEGCNFPIGSEVSEQPFLPKFCSLGSSSQTNDSSRSEIADVFCIGIVGSFHAAKMDFVIHVQEIIEHNSDFSGFSVYVVGRHSMHEVDHDSNLLSCHFLDGCSNLLRLGAEGTKTCILFIVLPASFDAAEGSSVLSRLSSYASERFERKISFVGCIGCLSSATFTRTDRVPFSPPSLLPSNSHYLIPFSHQFSLYGSPGFVSAVIFDDEHSEPSLVKSLDFSRDMLSPFSWMSPNCLVYSSISHFSGNDAAQLFTALGIFVSEPDIKRQSKIGLRRFSHESMFYERLLFAPRLVLQSELMTSSFENPYLTSIPVLQWSGYGLSDKEALLDFFSKLIPDEEFIHVTGSVFLPSDGKSSSPCQFLFHSNFAGTKFHHYENASHKQHAEDSSSMRNFITAFCDLDALQDRLKLPSLHEFWNNGLDDVIASEYRSLPLLRRETLSNEDIELIREKNLYYPCPHGWSYTGVHYVSAFGQTSEYHPKMEEFIDDYIENENIRRQRHNESIPLHRS